MRHPAGTTNPLGQIATLFDAALARLATPTLPVCETCGERVCRCVICDECDEFVAPSRAITQPGTGEVVCWDCLERAHHER